LVVPYLAAGFGGVQTLLWYLHVFYLLCMDHRQPVAAVVVFPDLLFWNVVHSSLWMAVWCGADCPSLVLPFVLHAVALLICL